MSKISETINDKTGYANGTKFPNAQAVRDYFTPAAQRAMFGDDAVTDELQLDDWANWVIFNASHMETR